MSSCTNDEHKVYFVEVNTGALKNCVPIDSWRIDTICPTCIEAIREDQIGDCLRRMYSTDVAELIMTVYKHKRAYLEAVAKLSANGVNCSFGPDDKK